MGQIVYLGRGVKMITISDVAKGLLTFKSMSHKKLQKNSITIPVPQLPNEELS